MNKYLVSAAELGQGGKIPLSVFGSSGEVFYEMALEMVSMIEENERNGKQTVMICPVGPVGQYPIFTRLIMERGLSLKNCWFINMDEYLTEDGKWIDVESPLSFHGFMERKVYAQIPHDLTVPKEQRIFPDPDNLAAIPALIEQLGGVDIAFGGIGINGHLAFNEPEDVSPEEFAGRSVRVLEISPETRTANAIGDLGGALEAMPRRCVTIGMKEILGAKKIRLGVFRDWHRAVVRRAVYGEVSAQFPVTLCQNHPDTHIYVNDVASPAAF